MTFAKLNESSLLALGMDKVTVDLLRHVVAQTGDQVGAPTLPQVAAQADTFGPIVANLGIQVTALQSAVRANEGELVNVPKSNNELVRRLDEIQADMQGMTVNLRRLESRIEQLENGVL